MVNQVHIRTNAQYKKMEIINKDTQIAQMRNLNLFLRGNRLKGKHLVLYTFLYKKAMYKRSYAFDLALCVTASTLGFSKESIQTLLNDLKKRSLFNFLEVIGNTVIIDIKNFESYGRASR